MTYRNEEEGTVQEMRLSGMVHLKYASGSALVLVVVMALHDIKKLPQ